MGIPLEAASCLPLEGEVMARFLHELLVGVAGASVLAAAGCAGRPQPIPAIATLEPYNGEWVLEAADRSPVPLQFMSRDGYGFSRETVQRIIAIMGIRAERFVLEVNDSIFRVSSDEPGFSLSLPVDGTPIEVQEEESEVARSMRLSWSETTPVVRRTLTGTGWASDRYELTADGALVITRRAGVRNVRGSDVEATRPVEFVYVRSTGFR